MVTPLSFSDFKLNTQLLETLKEQNYQTPTPIQAEAIPHILEDKDLMAAAQTGTGKTAAFVLPILEKLSKKGLTKEQAQNKVVRTLILTPTRELAAQVEKSAQTYGDKLPIKKQVVYGGVNINPQLRKLSKGTDILVATPGRLIDLYKQGATRLNKVEIFVLDEADRMLDMGFIHDIRKILAILPKIRQTLMFSATFSTAIKIGRAHV